MMRPKRVRWKMTIRATQRSVRHAGKLCGPQFYVMGLKSSTQQVLENDVPCTPLLRSESWLLGQTDLSPGFIFPRLPHGGSQEVHELP